MKNVKFFFTFIVFASTILTASAYEEVCWSELSYRNAENDRLCAIIKRNKLDQEANILCHLQELLVFVGPAITTDVLGLYSSHQALGLDTEKINKLFLNELNIAIKDAEKSFKASIDNGQFHSNQKRLNKLYELSAMLTLLIK